MSEKRLTKFTFAEESESSDIILPTKSQLDQYSLAVDNYYANRDPDDLSRRIDEELKTLKQKKQQSAHARESSNPPTQADFLVDEIDRRQLQVSLEKSLAERQSEIFMSRQRLKAAEQQLDINNYY